MKHTFLVTVLGVVSGLALAQDQQPSPPSSTASIEGIVTKEPGNQPVKKVVVQVIADDQSGGSNYTATTVADGRFRIDKVAAGHYRLYLEKTGFVEINRRGRRSAGQSLAIRSGEEVKDLELQMLPAATISGRVLDEDGDPMADVAVFVQRKKPGAKLETAGSERTNDLGEYRFHSLFPGQYLLVAMPPPDFHDYERQHENGPRDSNKPDLRYLSTYYPGTFDPAQAATITLRPGDEMPINFTLVPARTYRVRGMVTGIPVGQKVSVDLTSAGNRAILRSNEAGDDGQFEVRGVPPGTYQARAIIGTEEQAMAARTRIEVVAADVEGVRLTPMKSFTVDGQLRFDARPDPAAHYTVNLRSTDATEENGFFLAWNVFNQNANADQYGRVQWKNVRPGTYVVQVYGADRDSYLKSVLLGDGEVDTGFTIIGPVSLDVIVSARGGLVEGLVTDHDQQVADATIVFVPEEKYRKIRAHFATVTSDQHGHFTVRGLAPGIYSAYAWQDVDDGLYFDSGFLKSQEANAVSVKVNAKSQQSIELKLSPIAEE
jgi:hypothetical protein